MILILFIQIDFCLCVWYGIDKYQCEVKGMSKEREMAQVFKVLSDENRIRILKQLQTGEKCGCELLEELKITQPTLSHHMKILCDCDIVKSRREGKWMYYTIDCDGIKTVRQLMQSLLLPEHIPADCICKEG